MTQRQYQLFPNTDIFCSGKHGTGSSSSPIISDFPAKRYFVSFFLAYQRKRYISTLDYVHLLFLQNRSIVRPFAFAGELAWPSLLDWRGVVWNREGEWNCHKHLQIDEKGHVESIVVVV